MSDPVERLLSIAQAADAWERAYTGWQTSDVNTRDQHRVTTQAELHAAETRLVEAVRKYRCER